MKRFRWLLFLAGVGLAGCAHRDTMTDVSAPGAPDSAYIGLPPTYPRAKPVALPGTPAVATPKAPPPSVAVSPPQAAAAPMAPDASSEQASAPIAPLMSAQPSAETGTPQTPSEPAPLETTPPSPPVATLPPRPMDENEAKRQVVLLETSLGNIVIELNDVAAPRTCGNFRKLVSNGFYNHTLFHRVIPHYMIQGGDPNSKTDDRRSYGLGDPGYTLPAEIELKNVAGAVAMARLPDASNPRRDSNGSQFYICVADCPNLDDKYTVFAHVIRGMDTVNKIANQPRDKSDDPLDRIEIQASLETKQQALDENPR